MINAYQEIETDKKLVIVGPSFYTQDYENKLKEQAKDNPNIIFLGAQYGQTLKELFSNAYIFIHPSEQEGLPLTVLEAASFGRSLLLSDIKAHQEMFEDLPFFFRNKNVKNLKENLESLLRNPHLIRQRARKIKSYSRSHYNWDRVVESTILKYASVVI